MYAWSQLISVKKSTSCLDLQKSIWDHWLCIENISDIPLMDWINGLCQRVLTKDLMTLKLRVAFSEKLLVPLIDDVILGCWGLCILIEQGDTITHDCLNVEFVTKYLRWPHSILTNPCAVCTCHLIVQVCIQYMNMSQRAHEVYAMSQQRHVPAGQIKIIWHGEGHTISLKIGQGMLIKLRGVWVYVYVCFC